MDERFAENRRWRSPTATIIMWRDGLCGVSLANLTDIGYSVESSPHNRVTSGYSEARKSIRSRSLRHRGSRSAFFFRGVTAHVAKAFAFISKSTSA